MSERFRLADTRVPSSARDRYWQRRARGECVSCMRPTENVRCDACMEAFRTYQLVWQRADRARLYAAARCAECKVRKRRPTHTMCHRCAVRQRARCRKRRLRRLARRLCVSCSQPLRSERFTYCGPCRRRHSEMLARRYDVGV